MNIVQIKQKQKTCYNKWTYEESLCLPGMVQSNKVDPKLMLYQSTDTHP